MNKKTILYIISGLTLAIIVFAVLAVLFLVGTKDQASSQNNTQITEISNVLDKKAETTWDSESCIRGRDIATFYKLHCDQERTAVIASSYDADISKSRIEKYMKDNGWIPSNNTSESYFDITANRTFKYDGVAFRNLNNNESGKSQRSDLRMIVLERLPANNSQIQGIKVDLDDKAYTQLKDQSMSSDSFVLMRSTSYFEKLY